jgi:hypothetical protein
MSKKLLKKSTISKIKKIIDGKLDAIDIERLKAQLVMLQAERVKWFVGLELEGGAPLRQTKEELQLLYKMLVDIENLNIEKEIRERKGQEKLNIKEKQTVLDILQQLIEVEDVGGGDNGRDN